MGKLFTQTWYDRVEALIALALARAAGSASGTDTPWVDVPAGTTIAPTQAQKFLSCASGGLQTTVNLSATPSNGQEQWIRLTGTTAVTPVIVNAGAGTTIELVGGPLGQGSFGASTYLPYEAMIVGFKFDRATSQWKQFAFSRGNTTAAQQQAAWFFTGGNDRNSGVDLAHALATPGEVIRRLGGTVGDRVALEPIGGGADDWVRVMGAASGQGIAQAGAATGTSLVLGAGIWQCKTALPTPSNSVFIGTPATTITLALANGGIAFVAFQLLAVQNVAQAQTLAANNVPGSNQVSAAGAPAGGWIVGSYVQLQTGLSFLHGSTYKIVSVVPAGPDFTLTFDRNVLYTALTASSRLVPCVPPVNVEIQGNGMTMNGSATQFIEMLGAINCKATDIVMDGSTMPSVPFSAAGAAIDGAFCVNCAFYRLQCTCTGGGIGNAFWGTGEGSVVDDCVAINPATQGIVFGDNAFATLSKFRVYGSLGAGILLTSDGAATGSVTNEGNTVSDCYATGCVSGIYVTQGYSNANIHGCVSEFNGEGITLTAADPLGGPTNININNCSLRNNTNNGLHVGAGVKGTICSSVDVTGNLIGVKADDDCTIVGIVSKSQPANGNAVVATAAAVVTVTGYDFTQTVLSDLVQSHNTSRVFLKNGQMLFNAANGTGYHAFDTSRISVDGAALNIAQAVIAFATPGGNQVISMKDITTTGAGAGGSLGVNAGAGSTVRIGTGVNLTGIATANQFTGAAHYSRSAAAAGGAPVVLAGLAAQAVAWPDLTYADDIMVELVTPGGTPGPVQVTKTPGVGFSLAGTNAAEGSRSTTSFCKEGFSHERANQRQPDQGHRSESRARAGSLGRRVQRRRRRRLLRLAARRNARRRHLYDAAIAWRRAREGQGGEDRRRRHLERRRPSHTRRQPVQPLRRRLCARPRHPCGAHHRRRRGDVHAVDDQPVAPLLPAPDDWRRYGLVAARRCVLACQYVGRPLLGRGAARGLRVRNRDRGG